MTIAPGQTKVGWIGTGVMGQSMCGHVLNAGYAVTVYTRTPEKAQALLDQGAAWAETPKAVAENADVVVSMVGYPRDVREITLGENGTLAGSKPGHILVDMTTSEPSLAQEICEAAQARGVYSVDAPVSGGDIGAREARLAIMVGGDPEPVQALQPLFEVLGKNIRHMGPAGSGQHTKMANQIIIASTVVGMVECLLYGYKAGLDLNDLLAAIGKGAAGCWALDNYAPRILRRDFEPGFFVEHFIKDMGIALEESRRMGLCMPGLALANQLYIALQAQGYGRKGTQALALVLEQMSQTEMLPR
jgi:3-hydroxyisobutyrate dehydrogenase